MRSLLLAVVTGLTLVCCALLAPGDDAPTIEARIRLVDAETGQAVGGMVRVYAKDGTPLPLPGLLDRLIGLEKSAKVAGWHVVPAAGATTRLPKDAVRIEAVAGLETALREQPLDLAKDAAITVKLRTLFRPEQRGLVAGNTHLHLRKLSLAQATDYLKQIPAADGLKVMFISYLERHKDDADYITNRFPIGDLKITGPGVLFNNGEEHRHNFEAYGQGYGHVMFLNIKELVQPVSIGPGITGGGFDEPPLGPGIVNARRQGGTIVWCHNTNGHEGAVHALAGRLDALNVFDGSRTGSYEDKYYRYLNIGLRLPISTGTDWFMYDFSRVYAKVNGPLTVPAWLNAVKAGRCQATNGPLLTLTIDGKEPGDVIALNQAKAVKVEVQAIGRHDLGTVELIQNGKVVETASSRPLDQGGHQAALTKEVRLDAPAWFAARIRSAARNEFDQVLFAHTSPVYVDFAGQRVFDLESAQALLKLLESARADIRAKGKFSDAKAQEQVLAVYDAAAKDLTERINRRGKD